MERDHGGWGGLVAVVVSGGRGGTGLLDGFGATTAGEEDAAGNGGIPWAGWWQRAAPSCWLATERHRGDSKARRLGAGDPGTT